MIDKFSAVFVHFDDFARLDKGCRQCVWKICTILPRTAGLIILIKTLVFNQFATTIDWAFAYKHKPSCIWRSDSLWNSHTTTHISHHFKWPSSIFQVAENVCHEIIRDSFYCKIRKSEGVVSRGRATMNAVVFTCHAILSLWNCQAFVLFHETHHRYLPQREGFENRLFPPETGIHVDDHQVHLAVTEIHRSGKDTGKSCCRSLIPPSHALSWSIKSLTKIYRLHFWQSSVLVA